MNGETGVNPVRARRRVMQKVILFPAAGKEKAIGKPRRRMTALSRNTRHQVLSFVRGP